MNTASDKKRPNIILITDDEHRCDFFGGELVKHLETPYLDRLKQRGVTLPNMITNCPVCMPTRCTWLTGLYGSQSPAGPRNAKDWPVGHPTVAQALQRAGYQTAIIGKLHAYSGGSEKDPSEMIAESHARGFDHVFGCCSGGGDDNYSAYLKKKGLRAESNDSVTRQKTKKSSDAKLGGDTPSPLPVDEQHDDYYCREAVRWLGEVSADRPFFLHASFVKPHFPLDPPEPYFSKYKPEDMPKPVGVEDPERIKYWQQKRAVYCGLVEYTDRCIGKLLDSVESRQLMDNTIILFTTDHGDMMGDRDMYFKLKPFDASVRTPLIVSDPWSQRPGGTVLEDQAEAVDVPATILQIGSDEHLQEALPTSPGRSFLDYVRGDRDAHRKWAFSEQGHFGEGSGSWRLIRTREWKYIYSPGGDLLFNLAEDPLETNNLADDPKQLARLHHLRGLLIQCMGSLPVPPASLKCNTDPKDSKSLNSRFYRGIMPGAGCDELFTDD